MNISKQTLWREIRDYLVILIGLFSYTIGWTLFLLPNNISTGGVPGVSSILYWAFETPVQVTFFAVNAVLLLLALKILGFKFCIKTIYGVVMLTIILSFFQPLIKDTHLLADQPFMAAIIGGCFCGIGIGLGLVSNGSSGGTDIIAAIIHKYRDISLGHLILMVDLIVITSSYVVLRDWNQVLYGYVVLFVSSYVVDQVVNAMRQSVQFFIISEKHEEIARAIVSERHRGCTVIDGKGFYTGHEQKILFVLAKKRESGMIFQLINDIDPGAFVTQSAVIGVYGQGFDHMKVRHKK
ncbi:MAG: YitT family protein [Prevotella sp.]|nr:YitT family protein [Prevotella sp.]MBQ7684721.1 YitT family protein [Bacteroidaceae bacterium]